MNIKSSTKSNLYRIAAVFMIAMLALAALPTTQAFAAPSLSVSSITVAAQSGTLTYGTGGTATFLVTFKAGNGGSGSINPGVTPSVSGLPTGVTGVFSPSPTGTCFGNGCTVTSTLTLTTTTAAQAVTAVSFTVSGGPSTGNGSLTIGKRSVTYTAVTDTKVYDGTTSSTGVPTLTSGTLGGSDTASASQTFNTATVGTSKLLTPAVTISGGNANYTITLVNNNTGVINKATPTATLAVTNSPVTYNGAARSATVGITVSSVPGAVSSILTGGLATQTNVGTYAVTASFVPTDSTNYNTLTGLSAGNFVINKATPTATLAVSNSPVTYDGSAKSATVGISVSSVPGAVSSILTGGLATQTDAGTYAVTASFVPTDSANYNTLTGLSAGNFVINKATPTATLAVSNSPVTYDGAAHSATVGISASSVPGTVSSVLTGGLATQTNANTYAVTASFVPTDSANYNTLTGLSAGNFVINKATPTATLAVSNSPVTYDGSAKSATVGISASSVPGAVSSILTGGLATQTNANTYAVTASFVPTDSTNYNTLTGLSAGNFVINKATPTATLAVSNSPVTYNGAAKSATVGITASSVPGAVSSILTGGSATQTDAGTYAVTASFVPTDSANYNTLTGLSAGSFVINKATPTATLAVSNSPVIYDGTPQSATVDITVSSVPGAVSSILTGGLATQTDANTYAVTASFVPTDSANYNTLTGLSAGSFVINKATPTATLAVSNSPVTYDGSAKSATVGISASSVPGAVSSILTGGLATQTNANTYAVTASFVPTDSANYNTLTGLSAGSFIIDKAPLTITAQHDARVYNGTASSVVAPQITSGALVAPDTATLVQAFANKNVGTGKTLSAAGSTISDGNGGNNYAVTFVNDTTGAITKYDLEVTAATDTKEYDGDATSAGTPSITLGSLQTGDSAVWTQTFDNKNADTGKTITPAGTVSDGNGGNNYHIVFNTVSSGSITQRAITVTAVTDTKSYDGDATSTGTPTVSSGTIASGDTAAFTQSFENKNVGTGKTLTAAGAVSDGNSGNNYVVTFVDNATGEITIRNIEVTAASGNKVYDGTNSSSGVPTITNGSLASGDTATWEQSFDDKNAGNGKTLTATGSISDANGGLNYHISFVTALGNITPADLTVTANDKTIHVGSPTPAFDFAVAGFISPDDFTVIPICSVSGSPTTVGDYAITCASGNAGTNYNIIYVAGTYTITNKVILDVTASSATITYGDADPIITPSYSGFTNGDTVSVLNTAPTCSATGPFTVTGSPFATICSGGDDDKYDFNFINGSITVNPKALTITADNASKTYGSLASFSGSEFTDSGLINSDAIASVTLTSAGSAVTTTVGSYNIVPSAATGTGLGNYTITYANGSLTVGPKALVITVNNASKNYGATTTFTGTEFSAPALVNSDSVTSVTLTSTGAAATAAVGGYSIVPSAAVGSGLGNYTISYVNGTLSINPATLTITANNKTIGLGDPDPIFTFAYSGFVNSETATVVTTAPTCTVSGAHNAAGTYPIVCSGGGAANYNFNYVNGTLTVSAVASPINAYIGGSLQGSYFLTAGQSTRVNYAGVDSGPVKVVSTGGNPIISAIRSAWAFNGVTTSFSQLMGLPQEQLSDTYVFPGYNNVTLNDQLRIANVDTTATSVTVTIGGTVRGTYPLAAGAAVRINYPGLDSGPVVVKGTSGVKIISSIREAWAVNGTTTSFVQLMGLPAGQLSNKYVFPAYNNVTLDEQLRIGNVDPTQSTVVIVTIGGTVRGTYSLGPGQAVRINYPGLDSGPVIVEGTAGVNIISSIRSAWAVNGVTTSFSQLMGMPVGQLSDKYIFPGYNNVTLDDQLRIANVDTTATSVTVTIGGTVRGTYPLAAGAAVRINYTGLDGGPVVVQGTSGVKIISSIREAWAVNGVTQSFVQLMGLPSQQLSTTYLFPAYNNVTLNEQLRIAVP